MPTGTGPASQRGSLVRRGRRSAAHRPQGRLAAVDRRHSARHGSEQRTAGQPSLAGSRGGEGARVSPCRNAGQSRAVRPFATPSRIAGARSFARKTSMKSLLLPDGQSSARSLAALVRSATSGDYRTAPPKPSARFAGLVLHPPGEQRSPEPRLATFAETPGPHRFTAAALYNSLRKIRQQKRLYRRDSRSSSSRFLALLCSWSSVSLYGYRPVRQSHPNDC